MVAIFSREICSGPARSLRLNRPASVVCLRRHRAGNIPYYTLAGNSTTGASDPLHPSGGGASVPPVVGTVVKTFLCPSDPGTATAPAAGVVRGAYVLADAPGGKPEVLLLATGSEVALCLDAYERLKADGIKARVVSMPSWELFDDQPQEYRDRVLPPEVAARVSVEQASTFGWAKYVGATGRCIGMRSFGASAPLKDLTKKFGFTPEHVVAAAREQLRLPSR